MTAPSRPPAIGSVVTADGVAYPVTAHVLVAGVMMAVLAAERSVLVADAPPPADAKVPVAGHSWDLAGVVAEVRNALVPARHHFGLARQALADDPGYDLSMGIADRLDIAARQIERILGMATAIAEQLDREARR